VSLLDAHIPIEKHEVEATQQPVRVARKRHALSHKIAYSVPQIIVTALGDASVSAAFRTDPMTPPGNQVLVDTILVRIDLFAGVALGDRLPHRFSRCFVPIANSKTESLSVLIRPREPDPMLLLLASDKRPDLVALDRIAALSRENALFKRGECFDFF